MKKIWLSIAILCGLLSIGLYAAHQCGLSVIFASISFVILLVVFGPDF